MNRIMHSFILSAAFVAACSAEVTVEEPATKPNVVFILADDQGWGDYSVSGNVNLATPKIDSLARDGARFDYFYVCAVCSPTRAEILTGRYHTRVGVASTSGGGERFHADEQNIADVFKTAGYATGAFGKWHSGSQWPYHPNARGFDEFYGFASGHWGNYFSPQLEHNNRLVQGNGFIIDDLTDKAIAFIRENKNKPFFCYIPYNTPHSPMQVPERFWKKFEGAELQMRNYEPDRETVQHTRAALAMCENIDWNVGRVLSTLDELGLAENTIVIYLSDNGPNGWRWNGGLKGRKGSVDEGGVRTQCFLRWPAQVKAGTSIEPVAGAIDFLPTLADLCGISLHSTKTLDGLSLKPLLTGAGAEWPDRYYFNEWAKKTSVRWRNYRLDRDGRLFDIPTDPGQHKDLSGELPQVAAAMKQALRDWLKDAYGSDMSQKPFTAGHPDETVTFLPARDGIEHGTIQRSARFKNCSFFTHWTLPTDSITWDIEVLTPGT